MQRRFLSVAQRSQDTEVVLTLESFNEKDFTLMEVFGRFWNLYPSLQEEVPLRKNPPGPSGGIFSLRRKGVNSNSGTFRQSCASATQLIVWNAERTGKTVRHR
jgi:hypothetical protein